MQTTLWTRLKQSLGAARQWYEQTPERALDQAYAAALMIQAIEDEHFDGKPISAETAKYGANSKAVFQEELRKCLKIATLRLSEFKASRFIFNTADTSGNARQGAASLANSERAAVILEKLKFIDTVLEKYQPETESVALIPVNQTGSVPVAQNGKPQLAIGAKSNTGSQRLSNGQTIDQLYKGEKGEPVFDDDDDTGIFDKSGVLPRTIASTLGRIKRDLDPNSEQKVVQSFRSNKVKTRTSIRFLLILITVPLLVQQISKTVLVGPIVDSFRSSESADPFLNFELQETALKELHMFRERMEFDFLLGKAPSLHSDVLGGPALDGAEEHHTTGETNKPLTRAEQEERIEAKLKERAEEIRLEYSHSGSEAIKNIFADLCSLIAFAIVLIMNRREVAILKSFIDDTVYGLSDSAKAFIIILFTDMFVGFHSPHGWEVLLEGLSKHWGLPANQSFIFLFIATFPVVLDTIFKYWIFRYLNRISPSAVSTYKTMNE
ncbi:proton extrusion protein PcxA [Phormidium sp. FACHB-592]|uniref:Proton extrusion protein PxcA n=1 Tax=Stenomitos frigidus AS-A4 TaxID=2933935 RepID=A0ABV0KIC5_9CYAN|nr:proton extrusion protein PcxA [Phormidium sp. FACHB-592]MBD2076695.1 proton extrusion protein PcxA [Phormidium sp. FACHB-592]